MGVKLTWGRSGGSWWRRVPSCSPEKEPVEPETAVCYDFSVKFDLGILATQPVPEIVRQVQLAEALGFESVWMADSHLVCRELWVTLTACVLGTKRTKLGPGVTVPHTLHASVAASAILPQVPGQGFKQREQILRMFAEHVMARMG